MIIDDLNKIHNKGINFFITEFEIDIFLSPNEVIDYIKNPISFLAKKNNVKISQYKKWINFKKNPYCCAITKKGKPCKIDVDYCLTLEDFIKNDCLIFCHIHKHKI